MGEANSKMLRGNALMHVLGGMGFRMGLLLSLACLALPISSGAATVVAVSDQGGGADAAPLSLPVQQQLAAQLFEDIYNISGGAGEAIVAQKIALYRRIIDRCPDVPLAEESYWHLLKIMMQDVLPPHKKEALQLYETFNRRYPESRMRTVVSQELMKSLYQQGEWADLDRIASSCLQSAPRNQEGASSDPVAVFLHAEAEYNLGKVPAAQAGYAEILHYFPQTRMAEIARARLAAIGNKAQADN